MSYVRYSSLGQYDKAMIEFLTKSLNVFRELGDRVGEGRMAFARNLHELSHKKRGKCDLLRTGDDPDA